MAVTGERARSGLGALGSPVGDEAGPWGGHDTTTRRELLAVRGYPPEIVAGNGHPLEIAGNGHAPSEPPGQRVTNVGESPTCTQCDRPAVSGRPTCGAPDCVRNHKRARDRKRVRGAVNTVLTEERSQTAADTAGDVLTAPAAAAASSGSSDLSHLFGDAPDRLGPIYHALMLAGAQVLRVDVTVDAETWRIERLTP